MKVNTENAMVEQEVTKIPLIEIDDSFAFATGSKLIANIVIHIKEGAKKYKLVRTSKGGYTMQ